MGNDERDLGCFKACRKQYGRAISVLSRKFLGGLGCGLACYGPEPGLLPPIGRCAAVPQRGHTGGPFADTSQSESHRDLPRVVGPAVQERGCGPILMSHTGVVPWSPAGEDARMLRLAVDPPEVSDIVGLWGGVSAAMVAAVMSVVAWPGLLLGPTRLSGRLVQPVVEILPAGLDRVSAGVGPELDRSTLAMWESWTDVMGASPPGRPLEIVGFVAAGTWQCAVTTSAWLAGYGASLIVCRSIPTSMRLSEADYRGITVTVVDEHLSARVVVHGRPGPAPSAARTVAVRYREEYLFAEALSQGRLPTRSSVRSE